VGQIILLNIMDRVRRQLQATGLGRVAGLGRAAPGTLIYLFTLLITQLTLNTVDERLGRRLLLSESTNLHNMARSPVQVLIGSAFWTDTSPWLTYLLFAALLAVMVPVEQWLGTGRWLVTFASGHIGATLATLLATGYALRSGLLHPTIANVPDVGASYGLFAAAGILTYRLSRTPLRYTWLALYLVGLATALVINHQIADLGHTCAFLIGLALWPLARGRHRVAAQPAEPIPPAPGSAAPAIPAVPAVLSRRHVVAGAGIAVASSAALAGCSVTALGSARGTSNGGPAAGPAPSGPVVLGPSAAVPVGGGTIYPGQRIVVTQPVAGTFHGLSAVCTHQGCLVGEIADGTIDCPCHGSQFHLDGTVANGPASDPLPTRPITVRNGEIELPAPEKS
jgi:Rieske Fe-S protein